MISKQPFFPSGSCFQSPLQDGAGLQWPSVCENAQVVFVARALWAVISRQQVSCTTCFYFLLQDESHTPQLSIAFIHQHLGKCHTFSSQVHSDVPTTWPRCAHTFSEASEAPAGGGGALPDSSPARLIRNFNIPIWSQQQISTFLEFTGKSSQHYPFGSLRKAPSINETNS